MYIEASAVASLPSIFRPTGDAAGFVEKADGDWTERMVKKGFDAGVGKCLVFADAKSLDPLVMDFAEAQKIYLRTAVPFRGVALTGERISVAVDGNGTIFLDSQEVEDVAGLLRNCAAKIGRDHVVLDDPFSLQIGAAATSLMNGGYSDDTAWVKEAERACAIAYRMSCGPRVRAAAESRPNVEGDLRAATLANQDLKNIWSRVRVDEVTGLQAAARLVQHACGLGGDDAINSDDVLAGVDDRQKFTILDRDGRAIFKVLAEPDDSDGQAPLKIVTAPAPVLH
jgi:hypothetical protein